MWKVIMGDKAARTTLQRSARTNQKEKKKVVRMQCGSLPAEGALALSGH